MDPQRCPFVDPQFQMAVKEPCPVCGETGEIGPMWDDEPSKCVGDAGVKEQDSE